MEKFGPDYLGQAARWLQAEILTVEFLSQAAAILVAAGVALLLARWLRPPLTRRTVDWELGPTLQRLVQIVMGQIALLLFLTFLLIVLWAMSFYVLSIALYPPEEIASEGEPFNYFWFFCAVLGTLAADTAWTAMRGKLFTPWYYLPFVLHYAVLAILAERIKSRLFRRLVAWWFLLSVVAWSLGVRRFL